MHSIKTGAVVHAHVLALFFNEPETGGLLMNQPKQEVMMSKVRVTYDAEQHCTALKESDGKTLAVDCPYSGKGEEFSPSQLVATSMASCMFLSMGRVAQRNTLDISEARANVELSMTEKRIENIDFVFTMPANLYESDRTKLEKAAGMCPIKASFHPDTRFSVQFNYPE